MGARTDLLIAGEWRKGAAATPVIDKYTLEPFTEVASAGLEDIAAAVDGAVAAQGIMPDPFTRYEILMRVADLVTERRALFRETIVRESGFTCADAVGEIARALQTLTTSAEETKRLAGEVIPLNGAPGGQGRVGFTSLTPIGVVAAITPFNSPLNTVCHKVAPAFGGGNSVILKPASATPLTATLLVEAFANAGAPPGSVSLLHGPGGKIGRALLADQRVGFFAFTGSTEVGQAIQQGAGLRKTQMELGSISATIVCADADLDKAVPKIVGAAFRKAGQVCTSIQMLLAEEAIYDDLRDRILAAVAALRVGDPKLEETQVGPMISMAEADRVESWIGEAESAGARATQFGARDRAVLAPTVIENANSELNVLSREVFGPVLCLLRFTDFEAAIERINATPYGLATGLFTRNLDRAFAAARKLRVGSVHINETSSSRVDLMPYGGVKASGFGKEGPRYAMREMMEERLITISLD